MRGAYGDPGRDGGGVGESTAPGPDRRLQHHGQSPRRRCGIGAQGRFRAPLRAPTLPHPLPTQGGGCVCVGGSLHPSPPHGSRGAAATRREGMEGGGGVPSRCPPTRTPRVGGAEKRGGGGGIKPPESRTRSGFTLASFVAVREGRVLDGGGVCACVFVSSNQISFVLQIASIASLCRGQTGSAENN